MNTTIIPIKGDWTLAKAKLKQKYAHFTDDDLRYVEGKEDEFTDASRRRLAPPARNCGNTSAPSAVVSADPASHRHRPC